MNHTSQDSSQETVNKHLEEFIDTLFRSGYKRDQIRKDLIAALVGFERRKEKVKAGQQNLHRDGATIKSFTRFKKVSLKQEWYKKKSRDKRPALRSWRNKKSSKQKSGCQNTTPVAPIFVPRTPGGALAQKVRRIEEEYNKISSRRVKVVEEGGSTLSQLLFRPDPWEGRNCMRVSCPSCKHQKGGNCYKRSVTYRNVCLTC